MVFRVPHHHVGRGCLPQHRSGVQPAWGSWRLGLEGSPRALVPTAADRLRQKHAHTSCFLFMHRNRPIFKSSCCEQLRNTENTSGKKPILSVRSLIVLLINPQCLKYIGGLGQVLTSWRWHYYKRALQPEWSFWPNLWLNLGSFQSLLLQLLYSAPRSLLSWDSS